VSRCPLAPYHSVCETSKVLKSSEPKSEGWPLDGPVGMDLDWQRRLFGEVLDELDGSGDLTNQVLGVTLDDDKAAIDLIRYEMPSREDSY
jgi:hypothetical protein